jgi:hypothetical protein
VFSRKNTIENASGCRISVIYVSPPFANFAVCERECHELLKTHRGVGEWFHISPDDAKMRVELIVSKYPLSPFYIDYAFNDMPVSLMSEKYNITRQGVYFILKSCYIQRKTKDFPEVVDETRNDYQHQKNRSNISLSIGADFDVHKHKDKKISANTYRIGGLTITIKYAHGKFVIQSIA